MDMCPLTAGMTARTATRPESDIDVNDIVAICVKEVLWRRGMVERVERECRGIERCIEYQSLVVVYIPSAALVQS